MYIMRKDILIVDWLLMILFVIIVISKLTGAIDIKIIQPIFLILITIHIIQRRRIILASLKRHKK